MNKNFFKNYEIRFQFFDLSDIIHSILHRELMIVVMSLEI